MSTRTHVILVLALIVASGYLIRLIRLRQLQNKYALLWLTIGVLLVPLTVFPRLLEVISGWVGIDHAPTTFLFVVVGLLFFVGVHLTWELSRVEARVRTLAEEVALLRTATAASASDSQEPAKRG
jgi:hypothetical protein